MKNAIHIQRRWFHFHIARHCVMHNVCLDPASKTQMMFLQNTFCRMPSECQAISRLARQYLCAKFATQIHFLRATVTTNRHHSSSVFPKCFSTKMGVADDLTVNGEFVRKDSVFRNFISKEGPFPAEANRYHLYISLACPWAHRTLIVRKLKGLEDIIGLSVVHYLMLENGWEFVDGSAIPGCIPDTVNNFKHVKELYFQSDPGYTGRFTVPILYDKQTKRIVNNESAEIVRMFNTEFNEFSSNPGLDLYPELLRSKIDELNDMIYNGVNNGVYKAGFAMSQKPHEVNSRLVYDSLIKLEEIFAEGKGPFIVGDKMTETDIRLFTSLIRHDPVYYVHFKCNLIAVKDLPNLSRWLKMMYEVEGIKETVNIEHIKKHYYMSHRNLNPAGIVPLYDGPIVAP